MEVFLIILLGYIVPTIILNIIILSARRRMEKQHSSTWKQSTNLQELMINAQDAGGSRLSDEFYFLGGISMFFVFSPILNIIVLLALLSILIVSIIGWIFSKIPIK